MKSSPVFSRVYAVCIATALAISVAGVDAYAIPIPVGSDMAGAHTMTHAERLLEFMQRDENAPGRRESALPLPALELGETQVRAGRVNPLAGDSGFDRIAVPRGGAALADETQDSDRVFRDLYRSFAVAYPELDDDRAGRPDRVRRDSAQEPGFFASDFVQATENMLKEAIADAIEKGIVEITQQDLWDLGAFLSNLRQSMGLRGPGYAESSRTDGDNKDGWASQQQLPSAELPLAAVPLSPQDRTWTSRAAQLGDFIRTLLTEPVTIVSILGFLIMARIVGGMGSKEVRPRHRRSKRRRSRRRSAPAD